MNRIARSAATALLLLLAAPPAYAQPESAALRGESTQTRKRLIDGIQKLLDGRAGEAADDFQRIIDDAGDDLVSADGRQFRTARSVAHQFLAKLPPDALKSYRDRIDAPAKKLLDQARRTRDPRPLWLLLDRYFVSTAADEGLLLLGEVHFERGEFRAAELAWRRLIPPDDPDAWRRQLAEPDGLRRMLATEDAVYPDSKGNLAAVRARIVLAVIFQHNPDRAKAELAAFKQKHPGATGTLAGKTAPFADTLQTFGAAPPRLPPDATAGAAWPTFGGAPDRAGSVPGGMPRAWPARPTWREPIPQDRDVHRFNVPPIRPPFGHPVIVNGEVFVADGMRIFGYDLRTGERTRDFAPFAFDVPAAQRQPEAHATLTASGGRIYARLGPSAVRPPEPRADGKPARDSIIVCLDPRLKELWRLHPPESEKTPAAWEGAPLVSDRRLWAVYLKLDGGRAVHVACCYDPADHHPVGGEPPGRPAWTAELCDAPNTAGAEVRVRKELLTLAGRNVVFCGNNGVVVALDATTGRRAWGFRYVRSKKAVNAPLGDPAPAVAHNGRVYVAPADTDHVFALDAETGQLVWESGTTEGARILGVARNRLIVTVTGPVRSIRGLSLDTGSYRGPEGWIQTSGAGILSYGHGFVTDDVIVWPSREGLFFLSPQTGRPVGGTPNPFPAPPDERYFGHVAYADGVLVVVSSTHVWGFVAQGNPVPPAPDAPPRERFDAIAEDAEGKLAAGDTPGARAALATGAASNLPPAYRAWFAARLLLLSPQVSDPKQLPSDLRALLQPVLLAEWLLPADGVPVTLETLVKRHTGALAAPASAPTAPHPEDRGCGPCLNAASDFDRVLKLPIGVAPLRFIAGSPAPTCLHLAGPHRVLAVPLDQSPESEFRSVDLFTHAGEVRGGFVLAGPYAVAVYAAGRDPVWVFRVPVTPALSDAANPFRLQTGREPQVPHLSCFTLAGEWLLARIGDHHLIALDLRARRVAWVLSVSGRACYEAERFPQVVRFGPHYAVSEKFVIAQLSDGRRWFIALETGRVAPQPVLGDRTAQTAWPHAPAPAGENRFAVADGPGTLRLLDLRGRVRWTFEVEHDTGLAGDPPQARVWGDLLLLAVRRNHGVEIERLDATTGKPVWPAGFAFADASRVDLCAADIGAERAYVPAGNRLFALDLATGKTVWAAELPDSHGAGWVVRAGQQYVIVYPAQAIPREAWKAVLTRVAKSYRREPFVWRLPGLAGTVYDAWVDCTVPVLLLSPETGEWVGRFTMPARGPALTVWFGAGGAVFANADRVVWIK